jgi:hypothetical protein
VRAAQAKPTAGLSFPGRSSRARSWCGPGTAGPTGSW